MSDDTKLILAILDKGFDRVDKRFDRLEGRMEKIESRVDKLEESVTNLQLVVENEIRPSIQILAEGHMMLNEKLDRVLEGEKDREELKTRVDALEAGYRLMQDKSA